MLEWDGVRREARRLDRTGAVVDETRWTGPEPMYRAQRDAWLGSLSEGTHKDLVDGAAGAAAVAVCDAARRSSDRGSWEEVA